MKRSATGKKHPRVPFNAYEDILLIQFVQKYGTSAWKKAPKYIPSKNIRQCRDRWFKYLDPNIKNEQWSAEEDQKLIKLYKKHGPLWVKMSQMFHGRTDIQLKNRYKVLKRKEQACQRMNSYEDNQSPSNDDTKLAEQAQSIAPNKEEVLCSSGIVKDNPITFDSTATTFDDLDESFFLGDSFLNCISNSF